MALMSKERVQEYHEAEGQGLDSFPLVEAALLAHELMRALETTMAVAEAYATFCNVKGFRASDIYDTTKLKGWLAIAREAHDKASAA
jgi:hypothetical protein